MIEKCGLLIVYKRCSVGQYASGYMGCRLFPFFHILLFHCHQYQTHCSMTILHTYTVCYSYVYHSCSRMSLLLQSWGRVLITKICYCNITGLISYLHKSFELKMSDKNCCVGFITPTTVLFLTPYCTISYCRGNN